MRNFVVLLSCRITASDSYERFRSEWVVNVSPSCLEKYSGRAVGAHRSRRGYESASLWVETLWL